MPATPISAVEARNVANAATEAKIESAMSESLARVYEVIWRRAEAGYEDADLTFVVYLDNSGRPRGSFSFLARLRQLVAAELKAQGYVNDIPPSDTGRIKKRIANNEANLQRHWSHTVSWAANNPVER